MNSRQVNRVLHSWEAGNGPLRLRLVRRESESRLVIEGAFRGNWHEVSEWSVAAHAPREMDRLAQRVRELEAENAKIKDALSDRSIELAHAGEAVGL